jgi:hypothetical protein
VVLNQGEASRISFALFGGFAMDWKQAAVLILVLTVALGGVWVVF